MKKLIVAITFILSGSNFFAQESKNKFDYTKWELKWEDDFNYKDSQLDESWESQNGPNNHILCSRWRENVVVKDGVLHLENRKEKRGGQDWTSGSIWTRKQFKYGYFESRYKYAGAGATNNSFWLMTKGGEPSEGKRFEIDINEGHYPNEVSTNIHNWSDFTVLPNGKKTHPSYNEMFFFGTKPDYSIQLEIPVETKKIRLTSKHNSRFNLGEFRVYGVNESGEYPTVLSETADTDIAGLVNYARAKNVSITSSGSYKGNASENNLVDGNPFTSWSTQDEGEKWVEFTWDQFIRVGCIQFTNGWRDENKTWHSLVNNYKVQYFKDGEWSDISVLDASKDNDFSEEYHTYGLEWNEDELVFYFDGKELRRTKNDFCFSEAPIFLSLAIIKWHGRVTDEIDGTSMKVDYVRYYQKK
ncbi:glycoside hydrolase (GH16) [Formosa agariphila KMM 3901]|uniref:Glycoside hydrolase (GH16) n=1 Tax=Formosa agariphila (strain DSM 15362 / KCTC 12365 / LMG 23005 / KMM 3901 / M-2Alg 35-1) TaxID=1347342 RepID=T2KPC4_FORAG|nr:family 16 glycosylhydrolase [Formosa agariphila]CDF79829.1 glycoside hydrolase (GH16) [Formosa agariphila KMM 3901]